MANFTLQKLEQILGQPIVMLSFWRDDQKKLVEVTIESLPSTAQAAVLQFINNHLP
jgi:hypothetical protein